MKYCLVLIFLCSFFSGKAQNSSQVLDAVVAVVGNEPLLESDIRAQQYLIKQQNPGISDTTAYELAFQSLLENKLIITKALQDSIPVSEEEVEQRLDFQINLLIQQFGSEKRVEDVYGMKISEIRRRFKDQVRKQLMGEKLLQQKFANLSITPAEVEEFYRKFRDSLPTLPAAYELYHIVRYVEIDSSKKDSLLLFLKSLRDSIIQTGDFQKFAKRYSQDISTASDGGEIGWVKRGELVPEFEEVAFALRPGEVSQIVETPFGYHLIYVDSIDGIRRKVYHLLIKQQLGQEEERATIRFLDSLRKLVLTGTPFVELAKKYSQDPATKPFGGYLGKIPIEQLPESFRAVLDSLPDNGITQPLRYDDPSKRVAYHIVWKKRFIPAHTPNLEDDYDLLKQMALQEKRQVEYKKWVEQLKAEIFWERRDQ